MVRIFKWTHFLFSPYFEASLFLGFPTLTEPGIDQLIQHLIVGELGNAGGAGQLQLFGDNGLMSELQLFFF